MTDIKSKIVQLQNDKPKSYVKIVEQDPELKQWVIDNTLVSDDTKFVAKIYSAVNQVSNICPHGKTKKYARLSQGFVGCGPASVCKCTATAMGQKAAATRKNYSPARKAAMNAARCATNTKKYGYAYHSQRPDIKEILRQPKIDKEVHKKLMDSIWLENEYVTKQRSLVDIAEELNVYYSTVGEYCRKHGFKIRQRSCYSLTEKYIVNFIEELGISAIHGDWDVLGNKELDIVIPSAKLAIEVDGLRWHSWNPYDNRLDGKTEDRFRHIRKTIEAAEKGYQLLHFTDYDWLVRPEKVKDIIKTKLGLNTRIFARKCNIVNVTTAAAREFVNAYHLQGFVGSSYYYGLEYNGELMMIMTLKKIRFEKSDNLEIIRVCSKHGHSVVGGLSKLLKHAIKTHKGTDIVTYCDAGISDASGYIKAGMSLIGLSDPGYFWTDSNSIISRFKCQAANLQKWLPNYDPTKSESENMFREKYRRFWNCGNYKLIYKNQ